MSKPRRRRGKRSRQRKAEPAEPWRAYLWKGRSDPQAVAFAKSEYERDEMHWRILRSLKTAMGAPATCRRKACRRIGTCLGDACMAATGPRRKETPEDLEALAKLRLALRESLAARRAETED